LKAFRAGQITERTVVFGDLSVLKYCNQSLRYDVDLRRCAGVGDYKDGPLNVIDAGLLMPGEVTPGKINPKSGAAARQYVITAIEMALRGEIAAVTTLPMNKEATQLSDASFVGHTELIAGVCGVQDVTIMLASEQLVVTHVSTHVSLREAIERVKKERISKIIQLTCDALLRFKPDARVAVAGLNPHAGEGGLFGHEEVEEIVPAVEWAKSQGLPVAGPFPPDTIFYLAVRRRRYDAVICMYHDQGHIPLKLLDFEGGVNVALGLPIVRTSVDHGTAFDIAYQGSASTTSLLAALRFAAALARGN
jgi:4-hydroxythreonine-4-phosphate dehydrogenase